MKGHFLTGQMLNQLGKHAEAKASFEAIIALEDNSPTTLTYKLLAKSEQARSMGLGGDTDAAIKANEEIIRIENSDNKRLFAHLYNSLGTLYLKAGKLKEAARAFMHTELLFASEMEPHSEALYNLAQIWPKLEQTDRANLARETLRTRYSNSYWAGKL